MNNCYPSESRLHDAKSRQRKAHKILTILDDFMRQDLSRLALIDVGCSRALITRELAGRFAFTLGLDIDQDAVAHARRQNANPALALGVADAGRLPCADESFDVAICAQVYEHVPDQQALMAEIWRVLRPEGICFFSGPNRLALIEDHYGLLMLSWLPRPVASRLLRLTGRGQQYLEQPRTYWTLRRLLDRFDIVDYTAEIVRNPEHFSCGPELGRTQFLKYAHPGFIRLALPFVPNYNWILRKRDVG